MTQVYASSPGSFSSAQGRTVLGDITSRFMQQPQVRGASGRKGKGRAEKKKEAFAAQQGNFECGPKHSRRESMQRAAMVSRQPNLGDFGRALAAVR